MKSAIVVPHEEANIEKKPINDKCTIATALVSIFGGWGTHGRVGFSRFCDLSPIYYVGFLLSERCMGIGITTAEPPLYELQ